MKRLRYWLIQLLGISKSEANGAILLMFLFIVAVLSPSIVGFIYPESNSIREKDQILLDSLLATLEIVDDHSITNPTSLPEINERTITLEPFNPNTASLEKLMLLGLSQNQARQIINYRSKGGTYVIKSDLLRMYGIDSSTYSTLEPYIALPVSRKPTTSYKKEYPKKQTPSKTELTAFDINLADTTQLKQIRGIGSVLSLRIVLFRESLGGFISVRQLDSVYGLEDEPLKKLKSLAVISEHFSPKQININTADFATLIKHPYINKKIASSIVAYRNQHGNYANVKELENIHLIKKEQLVSLLPYLTVE